MSGYCQYDAPSGCFSLSDEQAAVLADESTPAFLAGAMTLAASMYKDEELVRLAFGSGAGLGWHAHADDLFHGVERLFKPGYLGSLVAEWIPALDGVDARLRSGGASIADVGCGHGASTILLAREYPDAEIVGFDNHEESINEARRRAADAGLADRVRFQVASAQDFPGSGYDLVCIFDALHDMGDPLGAARHIGQSLADDGTWMLVEPSTAGALEDNVNPVSRVYYSGAVGICTPAAQAQSGGFALGNQVDDDRWRDTARRGRVLPLPSGRRDAVQPHLRGEEVSAPKSPQSLPGGVESKTLAYDVAGNGDPPLVFLHGWCGDRSFFAPQFDHFSATHRVVALDLPGHGESPAPAECTIDALASEVVALVGHLELEPSVLFGHSIGAMVALALTQQMPDLVRAVVMTDPPPLSKEVWKGFAAELIPSFQGPDGPAGRRRFVEQMFLPTDDADRRAQIIKTMCAVPNAIAIPMVKAMAAFDSVAVLRECDVPILVIASAVPTNDSSFLLQANPTITIGQTVGAGHFHQLEVPEQVNPMIERFLSVLP